MLATSPTLLKRILPRTRCIFVNLVGSWQESSMCTAAAPPPTCLLSENCCAWLWTSGKTTTATSWGMETQDSPTPWTSSPDMTSICRWMTTTALRGLVALLRCHHIRHHNYRVCADEAVFTRSSACWNQVMQRHGRVALDYSSNTASMIGFNKLYNWCVTSNRSNSVRPASGETGYSEQLHMAKTSVTPSVGLVRCTHCRLLL